MSVVLQLSSQARTSSLVHSHWSRNLEARLSLVESFMVRWCYTSIRDRWLPCTERSYYRRPYAIRNQRRHKMPSMSGAFCMPWAWHSIATLCKYFNTMKLSTNESQASTFLDQWEWTRLFNTDVLVIVPVTPDHLVTLKFQIKSEKAVWFLNIKQESCQKSIAQKIGKI